MAHIKVAVRVRPISERELNFTGSKLVVRAQSKEISLTNLKVSSWKTGDSRERVKTYGFDYCFDSSNSETENYATQAKIYETLGESVLDSLFSGYNACLVAYGQSSSGKTYTMMGTKEDPGLTPRLCKGIFARIAQEEMNDKSYQASVSYLEIYNERVRDLLKPTTSASGLRVREHPRLGPYVQGLTRHTVSNLGSLMSYVEEGIKARKTASTLQNPSSSRSHALLTVSLSPVSQNGHSVTASGKEKDFHRGSKLHLVDLAGSESAATCSGIHRLKEGANINKSLVALGNVISALAERGSSGNVPGRRFIPYRDSSLTWLLKDALGGNATTIMFATISPASGSYNETAHTLRFAQRAQSVVNRPVVNEDPIARIIRELRTEVARLNSLLLKKESEGVVKPVCNCGQNVDQVLENEDEKNLQVVPLNQLPLPFLIEKPKATIGSSIRKCNSNESLVTREANSFNSIRRCGSFESVSPSESFSTEGTSYRSDISELPNYQFNEPVFVDIPTLVAVLIKPDDTPQEHSTQIEEVCSDGVPEVLIDLKLLEEFDANQAQKSPSRDQDWLQGEKGLTKNKEELDKTVDLAEIRDLGDIKDLAVEEDLVVTKNLIRNLRETNLVGVEDLPEIEDLYRTKDLVEVEENLDRTGKELAKVKDDWVRAEKDSDEVEDSSNIRGSSGGDREGLAKGEEQLCEGTKDSGCEGYLFRVGEDKSSQTTKFIGGEGNLDEEEESSGRKETLAINQEGLTTKIDLTSSRKNSDDKDLRDLESLGKRNQPLLKKDKPSIRLEERPKEKGRLRKQDSVDSVKRLSNLNTSKAFGSVEGLSKNQDVSGLIQRSHTNLERRTGAEKSKRLNNIKEVEDRRTSRVGSLWKGLGASESKDPQRKWSNDSDKSLKESPFLHKTKSNLRKYSIDDLKRKTSKDSSSSSSKEDQLFSGKGIYSRKSSFQDRCSDQDRPHTPIQKNRRAEIVAAVTERLYASGKKSEEGTGATASPVSGFRSPESTDVKLAAVTRMRLQEISRRMLAKRRKITTDTQTDNTQTVRVKDKASLTDEPKIQRKDAEVLTDQHEDCEKFSESCVQVLRVKEIATLTEKQRSPTVRCKDAGNITDDCDEDFDLHSPRNDSGILSDDTQNYADSNVSLDFVDHERRSAESSTNTVTDSEGVDSSAQTRREDLLKPKCQAQCFCRVRECCYRPCHPPSNQGSCQNSHSQVSHGHGHSISPVDQCQTPVNHSHSPISHSQINHNHSQINHTPSPINSTQSQVSDCSSQAVHTQNHSCSPNQCQNKSCTDKSVISINLPDMVNITIESPNILESRISVLDEEDLRTRDCEAQTDGRFIFQGGTSSEDGHRGVYFNDLFVKTRSNTSQTEGRSFRIENIFQEPKQVRSYPRIRIIPDVGEDPSRSVIFTKSAGTSVNQFGRLVGAEGEPRRSLSFQTTPKSLRRRLSLIRDRAFMDAYFLRRSRSFSPSRRTRSVLQNRYNSSEMIQRLNPVQEVLLERAKAGYLFPRTFRSRFWSSMRPFDQYFTTSRGEMSTFDGRRLQTSRINETGVRKGDPYFSDDSLDLMEERFGGEVEDSKEENVCQPDVVAHIRESPKGGEAKVSSEEVEPFEAINCGKKKRVSFSTPSTVEAEAHLKVSLAPKPIIKKKNLDGDAGSLEMGDERLSELSESGSEVFEEFKKTEQEDVGQHEPDTEVPKKDQDWETDNRISNQDEQISSRLAPGLGENDQSSNNDERYLVKDVESSVNDEGNLVNDEENSVSDDQSLVRGTQTLDRDRKNLTEGDLSSTEDDPISPKNIKKSAKDVQNSTKGFQNTNDEKSFQDDRNTTTDETKSIEDDEEPIEDAKDLIKDDNSSTRDNQKSSKSPQNSIRDKQNQDDQNLVTDDQCSVKDGHFPDDQNLVKDDLDIRDDEQKDEKNPMKNRSLGRDQKTISDQKSILQNYLDEAVTFIRNVNSVNDYVSATNFLQKYLRSTKPPRRLPGRNRDYVEFEGRKISLKDDTDQYLVDEEIEIPKRAYQKCLQGIQKLEKCIEKVKDHEDALKEKYGIGVEPAGAKPGLATSNQECFDDNVDSDNNDVDSDLEGNLGVDDETYLDTNVDDHLDTNVDDYLGANVDDYLSSNVDDYLGANVNDYVGDNVDDFLATSVDDYLRTNVDPYIDTNVDVYLGNKPNLGTRSHFGTRSQIGGDSRPQFGTNSRSKPGTDSRLQLAPNSRSQLGPNFKAQLAPNFKSPFAPNSRLKLGTNSRPVYSDSINFESDYLGSNYRTFESPNQRSRKSFRIPNSNFSVPKSVGSSDLLRREFGGYVEDFRDDKSGNGLLKIDPIKTHNSFLKDDLFSKKWKSPTAFRHSSLPRLTSSSNESFTSNETIAASSESIDSISNVKYKYPGSPRAKFLQLLNERRRIVESSRKADKS